MRAFTWFELRTTDPTRAREFYREALGFADDEAGGRVLLFGDGGLFGEIGELPAQAAARGAPAHWLGHVGGLDVAMQLRWFLARGAMQLGPTRTRPDGTTVAALRDPLGAVVALTDRAAEPPAAVGWCDLHAHDVAAASACYAEAFGWAPGRVYTAEFGAGQEFAWVQGGAAVGGLTSAARMPGVHVHWLFHFRVSDLDAAIERVRACGGRTFGVHAVAAGVRAVACEDPQGAAFAMRG